MVPHFLGNWSWIHAAGAKGLSAEAAFQPSALLKSNKIMFLEIILKDERYMKFDINEMCLYSRDIKILKR